MNRNPYLITLALLGCCLNSAFSQSIEMRNFDWPAAAKIHTLSAAEAAEPAVVLEEKKVIEYVYNKNTDLESYYFRYRLIHINESNSVNEFNKIYVSVIKPEQLIAFRARAISPKGKVKEMLLGEMRPVTEDGALYMSIAIDGVEKGSEVEYFFVRRDNVQFSGTETIQTGMLTRDLDLRIISPENLVFASRIYNSEVKSSDTLLEKKRIIHSHFTAVPASYEELFSNANASKTRVEYKLIQNLVKGTGSLMTFADAGKYYYARLTDVSKGEMKDMEKLLSKMNVSGKSDEEKIQAIEGYLKTNFNIRENAEVNDMSDAIKKKIADDFTINKMAVTLTKLAKIKFEIVLTISRFKKYFDPDFESWGYLDEMMIYYPGPDMYMMPTNIISRLGEPPFQFIGAKGLFIREVSLGDITSAVSSIKKLPDASSSNSNDILDITVKISPDMTKIEQHSRRSMSGYTNIGLRPFYFYSAADKRNELAETTIKNDITDVKVTNIKVANYNMNSNEARSPFLVDADLSYSSLLEKAGKTVLFKIGQVIGTQAELYQEKPRQKAIEIEFPHTLDRTITVKIPEGYTAKGLDALNINITGGTAKDPSMGFISSYTLEGGILKVTIHEFYNQLRYPLAEYDQFRKVINASADFNKISIALEKKL